jgi:MoxR-like ATPase
MESRVTEEATAQDQQEQQPMIRAATALFEKGRAQLGKIISGQVEMIDQALLTLLCGGHALVEGVPGVAKTLTVKTLARFLSLDFRRVQGTPDMMPADILGTSVYSLKTNEFSFHRGPVFTQFLLADEINRMPPRTQAALLESMEERQITIDGVTYRLSDFFTVFATQNPIEFEGTYPLPEAQLDRFLLKSVVTYPEAEQEITILKNHHQGFDPHDLASARIEQLGPEVLAEARAQVKNVRVEPALFQYIVEIVRRTRDWPSFSIGASPRAAISLMMVAKGLAGVEERDYMIPDDVKAAALPVLRHRVILRPEAELEGLETDHVLGEVIASVAVPK